ncbi:YafY family transcriptional regulator [Sulfitobacter albidus]|uniref:YafY family transcriptional regulator n=1 Tax=Sulfitobacter albidus TaxID=2829501 RepID=A0A975JF35_9RHOB|nr:YafY family protein [Sulfitobacter albidus]QUJ77157.1 YafY family transcriptional regulator [Sulfitobacter albidus]
MRRADRLIGIAQFLRSRRRAVTAAQIGAAFGICTRTVYRDIDALVATGAPITGEAGVGYVIDKAYYLPPVTFDSEEAEALALGISIVRQWTDDAFAAKAESALHKIEAALPARMQGDLQQLTTYAGPRQAPLPWDVPFSDLREAIRARRYLTFDYRDTQDRASTRQVRPLALVFFSPVWLLAGWCETRGAFRHFRLDRITGLVISDARFADDPTRDLVAYEAQLGEGT